MEKMKKLKNLIREVLNLFINFFKPYGLQDELLEVPSTVKKMGMKVGWMSLTMTIIALLFSFLLKVSNIMLECRLILLGIIFFMLYRGQQIFEAAFRIFETSEAEKFDSIFEDEILLRGSKIVGNVSNKVLKFDTDCNIFKVMTNEAVMNTIKQYLQNIWQQKIRHMFEVFQMLSIVIMLIAAIITNTSIYQPIFIALIVIFGIIAFLCSAYISLNREDYYKKKKKHENQQSVIANDLLRVNSIVKRDLDMRIGKFQKTVIESKGNITKFHRKMNIARLFITVIETLSQYGVIIFYILSVEWNSIELATITEITATLAIVQNALGHIATLSDTLNKHNERYIVIKKEEEDMSLILDVYHEESKKISEDTEIKEITMTPFSIKYLERSENDRPFSLTFNNILKIEGGDVVILYGVSGSGKSTFIKLITERIKVKKTTKIPSTSRFLYYDESLKFGSLTIFEEIFCNSENPNLPKMQDILKNLHLWSEIGSNCVDVWKWMKERAVENNLSNGQKQRLILAKMLYWLDDTIDVVALDEATSGLDDKSEEDSADAERILEYIVRFCNKDKKRIIVLATHQNIDGFKCNIKDDFSIKSLYFKKEGEKNLITLGNE